MSDGSIRMRTARNQKLCAGWLEHKAHRANGYRYERLWMLLEDNVMYIFSTDSPTQETQIGNLTIDSNTTMSYRAGNPSKGFKFQLHTGQRLNQFRAKKSSERELWKGYLMGISKGTVPNDLDLLDTEVTRIQRGVAAFHNAEVCEYDPKRTSISSVNSMQSSRETDSGMVSLGPTSRISGSSSSGDSKSRITNASAFSSASGTLHHGGPTMVHKFYNDHNREQTPPSWFLPHCSREQAEKILEQAVSLNYGNTMMRESTSHLSNGSYVISKMISKSDGIVEYEHYEIMRTARGYKVNVQNTHEPMRCLHDVMEYFIGTSGRDTRPLTVNDLKRLGQDTPGYATQIYTRQDTPLEEPWRWPPSDPNGTEPVPDYDQSTLAANHGGHQNRYGREIDGSQTVSPGILRKRPSQNSLERKSVAWSSVVKTPSPLHQHNTFAGTRTNHPTPSMSELAQRSREADQLNDLATVIGEFERSSIYANTPFHDREEIQTRKRSGSSGSVPLQYVQSPPAPPPPPPPPPAPHVIGKQHSYANQDSSDHALAALPVAPPAPRDPIVSSPTATASNIRHASSFSSPSTTLATKTSTQSPAHSVQLRKTVTPNSIAPSTAQRKQFAKSLCEGQLRSTTSPNSPRNFPIWETNKQNSTTPIRSTGVANQTNKLEVFNEAQNTIDTTKAGVDEHTPGGVSTLRNKFEGNDNTSATPQKQGRKRGSLPCRWSLSSMSSLSSSPSFIQDNTYEDVYEDVFEADSSGITNHPTNTTNTSAGNSFPVSVYSETETNNSAVLTVARSVSLKPPTNSTDIPRCRYDNRQRRSTMEDDLYDDTGLPEQPTADRRTQFPQQRQHTVPQLPGSNPAPNNRLVMRRKTEPALTDIKPGQFAGLNPEFKNKLEGLFGGGDAGTVVGNRARTTSILRQFSNEDHDYQELPDILPDGVTYANERFNLSYPDNT